MHCNLASYEVLSWFLSLPWDYKTYTAKVLILICKVEEFVAGIEILETLRLVYAIQYPYNPDTRVGEGNLTKFLTSGCHIVKVFLYLPYINTFECVWSMNHFHFLLYGGNLVGCQCGGSPIGNVLQSWRLVSCLLEFHAVSIWATRIVISVRNFSHFDSILIFLHF